jgi:hypothetical protein
MRTTTLAILVLTMFVEVLTTDCPRDREGAATLIS